MAFTVGQVSANITADSSKFTRALNDIKKRGMAAVTDVEGDFQRLGDSFVSAGKKLTTRVTAPLVALAGVSVKAFDTQIQAEKRLEAQLKATGQEVKSNMADFKAYASSLQEVTTVGDESTLQMIQVAKSMGLTNDQAKRAAKNSIALAKAMGMNEQSAIRYAAALEQGQVTMLSRYLPGLREIEDMSERAAKAQELLSDMFGAATAEAQNGLGPMKQIKNTLGDISEEIGEIVLDRLEPLIGRLRAGVNWFRELDTSVKSTIVTVGSIAAAIGPVLLGLGGLIKLLPVAAAGFSALTGPIGIAVAAATAGAVAIVKNWESVEQYFTSGGGAKVWSSLQRIIEQTANTIRRIWDDLGDDIVQITETSFGLMVKIVERSTSGIITVMDKFNNNFDDELNIFEDNILTTLSKIDSKIVGFVSRSIGRIAKWSAAFASFLGKEFIADPIKQVSKWMGVVDKDTNDTASSMTALTGKLNNVQELLNFLNMGFMNAPDVVSVDYSPTIEQVKKTKEEVTSLSSMIGQMPNISDSLKVEEAVAGSIADLQMRLQSFQNMRALLKPGSEGFMQLTELIKETQTELNELLGITVETGQKGAMAMGSLGNSLGNVIGKLVQGKKEALSFGNILSSVAPALINVLTGGAGGFASSLASGVFGGMFHDGGIVPGGQKERMVRVKPGEGIFTQGQMRALGGMQNGGGTKKHEIRITGDLVGEGSTLRGVINESHFIDLN